jgi:hypothetical protein
MLIRAAATLAYQLNFCFVDLELESLLQEIGKNTVKVGISNPIANRIILYDSFGLDNKGLTQQYITALKQFNCDFLYILCNQNNIYTKDIMAELLNTSNASVKIIDYNLKDSEKIIELSKIISEFQPQKAFLHMVPWDVVGVAVWGTFKCVTRYLINLTDHAFWLGVTCLDYCIEFREYGATISIEQRGIQTDKLKYLQYYPVFNSERSPFQGLPLVNDDNFVVLSGGAFYKVYGEDGLYFKIILRILNENPKVIIFFAGSGEDEPFKNFIKENRLETKVFLIGSRLDLKKVFEKSDLYLCTFPVNGGLISLHASANGLLPISYTYPNLPFNNLEQLYNFKTPLKLTFTEIEKFHQEVNKSIREKKYRNDKALIIRDAIPTMEQFVMNFRNLIVDNTRYEYKKQTSFDSIQFSNLYLNVENEYLKVYHLIKVQNLKYNYFRLNFFKACYSLLYIIFYHSSFLKRRLQFFNLKSFHVQK